MSSPPSPPNLLIVDDNEDILRLLVMVAKDHGWYPVTADTGDGALELISPSLKAVILDHNLPGMMGIEVLKKIREQYPELPVIMLTGVNEVETAVSAMRAGATDYMTKPFELKPLFSLLGQCRQAAKKSDPAPTESSVQKKRSVTKPVAHKLDSKDKELRDMLGRMRKAAQLDSTILLTGESGTGKTRFAREIHRHSQQASESFITVSCPALPRELLESELFGHERGAFTGATTSRSGRFEQASNGTIFLDEIGDLPLELQPKLLSVLQDREYFRVGGNKLLKTNARIIAATNVNLRERVEQGKFREDLYYRLNTIDFRIPALRERSEDIPVITTEILANIAQRRHLDGWKLSDEAMAALCEYPWPGNIRELENVLERATAFSEETILEHSDFVALLSDASETSSGPASGNAKGLTLQELERNAFMDAYQSAGKNKAKTARLLGISERSVYNRLARYDVK